MIKNLVKYIIWFGNLPSSTKTTAAGKWNHINDTSMIITNRTCMLMAPLILEEVLLEATPNLMLYAQNFCFIEQKIKEN